MWPADGAAVPGPEGLAAPLVVAAHDAGGAEILSSLLRRQPGLAAPGLRLVLDGPALAVFRRKLGEAAVAAALMPLDRALHGAGQLLCGTGWATDLEWRAMAAARAAGVPAIAQLDHWVNYRTRFERGGQWAWPDALWVGDDDALALARAQLPGLPVRLVPNAYFADCRDEIAGLTAAQPPRDAAGRGVRVLYVCEPMREPAMRQFGNPRHHGYTEEEALDHALAQLPALLGPIERLVLRPHPSEAADKYDAQLAHSARPVQADGRLLQLQRGGQRPLFDEVAASDVVVGCNSMALVVGLIAGRRVVCAIPPGGAACVLPQRGIEHLRDLVSA